MEALFRCVLPIALIVTPALLSLMLSGNVRTAYCLATMGPCAIALNTVIPLALHLAGIPITQPSLASSHIGLLVVLMGIAAIRWRISSPTSTRAAFCNVARRIGIAGHPIGPLLLLYALCVIPFTYIAGIDTYKWQDLASGVAVERTIPWLVHPASLFGFTPRAYPSAQPLVLASIQILGNIGVDWGFYLISLLTGFTAITGAYALGERLYDDTDRAWWLAFLYGFSPLLMRYGYWATGRGFLLALLPFFVVLLLDARRPRALVPAAAMGVLLALSHKAGLVAVVLIPMAVVLSPLVTRCRGWRCASLIVIASASAGLLLAPGPAAWMFRVVSRFAWLFPLALLGLCAEPWADTREKRALFAAALLTMPLAFADDPYGALLAAPFMASAAVAGVAGMRHRWPGMSAARLRAGLAGLVLLAAGVVIARQAMDSPSPAVYRAARFLEAYDPLGPYRIDAPGRARTRMQAYVSGCPRFQVATPEEVRLSFTAPPPLTGCLRSDVSAWTRWFRTWADVSEAETTWYGRSPRVYYVRIDAAGTAPPNARVIYDRDGVAILASP